MLNFFLKIGHQSVRGIEIDNNWNLTTRDNESAPWFSGPFLYLIS